MMLSSSLYFDIQITCNLEVLFDVAKPGVCKLDSVENVVACSVNELIRLDMEIDKVISWTQFLTLRIFS